MTKEKMKDKIYIWPYQGLVLIHFINWFHTLYTVNTASEASKHKDFTA